MLKYLSNQAGIPIPIGECSRMKIHKQVLDKALENPTIKREYDNLDYEFEKKRKKIKSKLSKGIKIKR
jgi:hypothetical protein